MDIDPVYVDVAVGRYAEFCGKPETIFLSGPDGKETPYSEVLTMRQG
jgi:hypothetical protein